MRSHTSKASTIRRWRHYVLNKCDCHLYKNPRRDPSLFSANEGHSKKPMSTIQSLKNGFTSNLTTTILCLELWYIKLCYLYITYFIDTQSKTNNIPFSSELNVTNLFILFFCLHNVYLSKKQQNFKGQTLYHIFIFFLSCYLLTLYIMNLFPILFHPPEFFLWECCTRWSSSEERWPNSSICRISFLLQWSAYLSI